MGTEPWGHDAKESPDFVKKGPDYPATFVSWNAAMAFCTKLTDIETKAKRLEKGWRYTLPTEAQWEFACRAGTTTMYYFGDDPAKLSDYAWYDGDAKQNGEPYAHPVGQKIPNGWGLYDMHGDVRQWCRDVYSSRLTGGTDPFAETGSQRVLRGGSWASIAAACRSASREKLDSTFSYDYDMVGFRVALVPPGE